MYIRVRIDNAPLLQLRGKMDSINRLPPHRAFRDMKKKWLRRLMEFTQRLFLRNSSGGGDWAPLALSTVLSRRSAKGGTVGQQASKLGARMSELAEKRRQAVLKLESIPKGTKRALRRRVNAHAAVFKLEGQLKGVAKRRGTLIDSAVANTKILQDTRTLFASLTLKANGNVSEEIVKGVQYGIRGGTSKRRDSKGVVVAVDKPLKRRDGKKRSPPSIGHIAKWHHVGAGRLPVRQIIVQPDRQTVGQMNDDLRRAVNTIIAEAKTAR